jgi:hypothetical protein
MIKLKTLLIESLRSEDPNHVMYWILKHAPSIAAKLGEQIDKELGGGANGVAFLLQSGKVMKLTGDIQEVAAASRYRTKQNVPHIASVYDVRKLEGDIVDPTDPNYEKFKASWDRSRQFYVIILDAVTPLSEYEKQIWLYTHRDYLNPTYTDEHVKTRIGMTIDNTSTLSYATTLADNWLDKLIAQRQGVLAAFRRNSVHSNEAHEDNVGWNSQGQLVHFDWWMRLHSDYNETKYQTTPRRLNKPVKYDASGIDTPNDPTM